MAEPFEETIWSKHSINKSSRDTRTATFLSTNEHSMFSTLTNGNEVMSTFIVLKNKSYDADSVKIRPLKL